MVVGVRCRNNNCSSLARERRSLGIRPPSTLSSGAVRLESRALIEEVANASSLKTLQRKCRYVAVKNVD